MFNIKTLYTKKLRIYLLLSLFFGFTTFVLTSNYNADASGTISGTVFRDFNGNGILETVGGTSAVDKGLSGISVTVFDAAGVVRGSVTTGATGTYSIGATGTGPYRVEFTNLPAGYLASARSTDSINGGTASNSGSSVQFVLDGNTSNVNLAVNRSIDYCQNNPELVTTCFSGTVASNTTTDPVLISFPYNSGTTSTIDGTGVNLPTAHSLMVPQNNVGSILGLAYHRNAKRVFSGAFTKRHAGFRNILKNTASSDPTGEIFISNSTGTTGSLFLNLNTLFGSNIAGANPHDVADYFNDTTAFDAVGKTAFGDIDISEDEQTLYAVNLNNKNLYAIPLGAGTPTAPTNSSQVAVYDLVGLAGIAGGTCAAADLRPGALKVYNGVLYYGLTCTAQSTQNTAQLRAFVYSLNLTGSGTATQVASFALNYTRGFVTRNATDCTAQPNTICAPAFWRPWIASQAALLDGPFVQKFYPQPWLLDIEFDANNFMVVGLNDRVGHQTGNNNGGANTGPVEGASAGDILRLRPNGAVWTLESNASDGTNTTAGAGTNEGPGGGEFYFHDGYPIAGGSHEEITLGNLLIVPGFNDVATSAMDPAPTNTIGPGGANTYRAGGLIWLNNAAGSRSRSYQLFGIDAVNTFGKASGIGDIEAMCNVAPIQLGNRVWNDANGNGVQDPGEAAIAGVTVRLYKAGVLLATAVTDAAGEYYFTNGTAVDPNTTDNVGIVNGDILPNMEYEIRFDNPANYTGAGPLTGLLLTRNDETSQLGFDDGSDSDAVLVTNPTNSPAGIYPVITVTTGANGDNNYNLDAGFASSATFSLGNRVWFDTNNDGAINAGEVGISGVSMSVFADANTDGVPDGAALGTVNTDTNGYYRFDGLASGNYVVRVNPASFANGGVIAGHQNTTGANSSDLDSTSVAGQNGENGINPTGAANGVQTTGVLSGTIFLGAPGEPTSEADVQVSGQGAIDPAANMTVDFGFYCTSISGTLWNDTGAGPNTNNGQLDVGETRIPFIRVRLFNAAGVEIPVGPDGILGTSDDGTTNSLFTNSSGDYTFKCLPPGQYRVVVGGNTAGTSSTPTSTNPDDNIDNDDNGFPGTGQFSGQTISGLVTVTPGSTGAQGNTVVTNSTGSTANPTIDFGFTIAPTYIKLDEMEARSGGDGTEVVWSTGEESDNLGFNVYREVAGRREMVNGSLIAGGALKTSASLAITGDKYVWKDEKPEAGAVYYLEDIDMKGNATMHGPIRPTMKFTASGLVKNAVLLSDLSRTERDSGGEREYAGSEKIQESGSVRETNAERQRMIAGQKGARIAVDHDGWYRVTAAELGVIGFNPGTNRGSWQLYANGEEVPMVVNEDGSIEFFGRGNDTLSTNKTMYYLIEGRGIGRRVATVDGGSSDIAGAARSFEATTVREDRQIYVSALRNGEAKNFFGAVIQTAGATTQELTVRNPAAEGAVKLRVKLQGLTTGDHLVGLRLNGLDLGTVSYSGEENRVFEYDLPRNYITEGINQVQLQSTGAGNDVSLVDSIALTYQRRYVVSEGSSRFELEAGKGGRINGFGQNDVRVFEIRSGRVEQELSVVIEDIDGMPGISLSPAGYDREMLVIDESRIETAARVERNDPSSWSSSRNRTDLVIITPESLRQNAEQLAEMKRAGNIATEVVLTEDIYDEFWYGEHSPEAIREFLRTAASSWQRSPKYVILLGHSSYDPRNYRGLVDRDLVPTKLIDTAFQETGSDAWLADFNNDGIEDISLGRLPASSSEEATLMISKIVRYEAQGARPVSNMLVADRGFEDYNDALETQLPGGAQVTRIERTSLTDGEMHDQIVERLNAGPLLVTYTGHGAPGVWSSANVFKAEDAANLNNDKLSIYLMMTCLNGYILSPTTDSMAEALMKTPNGGAIAVWASTGSTYPDVQLDLSREVTRTMFRSEKGNRLGDLIRKSKQMTSSQDVRKTWHLIGDPTIIVK